MLSTHVIRSTLEARSARRTRSFAKVCEIESFVSLTVTVTVKESENSVVLTVVLALACLTYTTTCGSEPMTPSAVKRDY